MSRHVVINGRELSMNDAGFIDPNSEWSVTVGEDGSVEVNRLDLKEENDQLKQEIAELEGTIECLKGLAEANDEKCYTCEAMLDCDECLRADASHKELRGLQAENERLCELVADMWEFMTTPCNDYCERCVVAEECSERQDYDCCQWRDECVKRMQELGIEVE